MLDDNKQPYGPHVTFLFIVALLVGATLASHSQGPIPHAGESIGPPQPQPQQPYKESAPDQRGTSQSPLHVVVLPTPQTEAEAAAEAQEKYEQAATDRRVARFTEYLFYATVALSAIAFLQLFVFGWQGRQLRRTVDTMRMAERAHVRMSHVPPGIRFLASGSIPIVFKVVNMGRTPGTVEGIFAQFRYAPTDEELPADPDYSSRDNYRAVGYVLGAGGEDSIYQNRVANVDPKYLPSVRDGTARLWLFGYVDYRDIFGTPYRSGYARRYDPGQDIRDLYPSYKDWRGRTNLVILEQDGYNYDRRRRHDEAGHPAG